MFISYSQPSVSFRNSEYTLQVIEDVCIKVSDAAKRTHKVSRVKFSYFMKKTFLCFGMFFIWSLLNLKYCTNLVVLLIEILTSS